ncbi:MAG: hypothetical protein KY432_07695, partial [Acidobacteria bacterium]|nr:hypothetical protein [Acidobacteriota bacterium]
NTGLGQWQDVVGMPGAVYGVVNTGLKIVSLDGEPSEVEVKNFLPFGKLLDIEIVENAGVSYLVVLDGRRLRIHDLSNPMEPAEIASLAVPAGKHLAVAGTTVWILGEDAVATAVDLSEVTAPVVTESVQGMREGLAIAATGQFVAGADRWALWAVPLGSVEDLPPPHLGIDSDRGDPALLRWTAPPVRFTELQLSLDEQFTQIERTWSTAREELSVERTSKPAWVRARFVSGCSVGPWSASVAIDAFRDSRGRAVRRP